MQLYSNLYTNTVDNLDSIISLDQNRTSKLRVPFWANDHNRGDYG